MERKLLADALRRASVFVNPRSPAESHKLLTLKGDGSALSITGQGSYGLIRVVVPSDCELHCAVNAETIVRTLGSIYAGDVDLEEDANRLAIIFPGSKVSIPMYDPGKHEIPDAPESVSVNKDEFVRCIRQLAPLYDRNESRFAVGIRMAAKEGKLFMVSAVRTAVGITNTECFGDAFVDFVMPSESAQFCAKAVSGDSVSLSVVGGRMHLSTEGETIITPAIGQGRKPPDPDILKPILEKSRLWDIQRQDLWEAMRGIGVFATSCASAIRMTPQDGGVMCKYTGEADGLNESDMSVDGHCEFFLPGDADGEPAFISHLIASPVVSVSGTENWKFYVGDTNVSVVSDGFVIAFAQMGG